MRILIPLCVAATVAAAQLAGAQTGDEGRILGKRAASPTVNIKASNPEGSIRFIGWDKDTVMVRGTSSRRVQFMLDGGPLGMKMTTDGQPAGGQVGRSDLVAYVPRRAMISVRTVTADITAENVGGAFYTVSGNVRLSGHGTSFDVESMNGNLDLNVSTPWIKARTGSGHLLLRGEPQDADVSTVSGTLSIATAAVLRGQFASVSGDIHYAASPAPTAIFEFSNHSGEIDLLMPTSSSAALTLSSISGPIENGFVRTQPARVTPRSMKVNIGRGDAQITVRSFKGAIRLRPQ
jgi:DUF4097 and DUF4098 domain-containing protein YvlB